MPLEYIPLSPAIGAEVRGVDLSGPISDALGEELHRAWLRYKVLFFRDQSLTMEDQIALADHFGGPATQSTFGYGNADADRTITPGVQTILHDAENGPTLDHVFHTDSMWWEEPPRGAILTALELPPVGGDTLFADMAAAFDGLSPLLREFLEPRRAVIDIRLGTSHLDASQTAELSRQFPPIEHPLSRIHPDTGAKAIYACALGSSAIVGLRSEESRAILNVLFAQAHRPEYQCRFRWSVGSVAIWDNRVTQHCAVLDYLPQRRHVRRVFLAGQKPV
jgi:taurine dioxygenase